MRLLVFGQSGQVATELARRSPEAMFLSRSQTDLADHRACANAIRAYAPDGVINAAAYTAVDRAEENEALAMQINSEAPGIMARECAMLGIPLVHISTDYVFSGGGTAGWRPNDIAAPKNAYGRSKLAGERAITQGGAIHAILRTSWVFSAHGSNFVNTMLRLSRTRDALSIVDDQIGGPTYAADIAAACLTIAEQLRADPNKTGIYHYSGAPDVSWRGFGEAIFALMDRKVSITGISTEDYPTPAQRPLNSRLDCGTTETFFALQRPDWRAGLRDVLTELGEIPA